MMLNIYCFIEFLNISVDEHMMYILMTLPIFLQPYSVTNTHMNFSIYTLAYSNSKFKEKIIIQHNSSFAFKEDNLLVM